MDVKREQPLPSPAHDTYDLAVTLRSRLADAVRSESSSVASQLQSAARERLGSDGSARVAIAPRSVRVAAVEVERDELSAETFDLGRPETFATRNGRQVGMTGRGSRLP
jgi:hypothetical protein